MTFPMEKYIKVPGEYDLKSETIKEKRNPYNYFLLVIKHITKASLKRYLY